MQTISISRWPLALVVASALAACQPVGPGADIPASAQALPSPAKNGARIYFTAVSDRGSAISYSGGPRLSGGMMGGIGQWLTCASCHGLEGRGGVHTMHMSLMKAPDIRYAALASMPELKGRTRPYDFDDFRKTVETGRHPDGEELDADMPRWQMNEADLNDLFSFLKTLSN